MRTLRDGRRSLDAASARGPDSSSKRKPSNPTRCCSLSCPFPDRARSTTLATSALDAVDDLPLACRAARRGHSNVRSFLSLAARALFSDRRGSDDLQSVPSQCQRWLRCTVDDAWRCRHFHRERRNDVRGERWAHHVKVSNKPGRHSWLSSMK